MDFEIRRFQKKEADETSAVIERALLVSNAPDYPSEIIQEMIALYSPGGVLERGAEGHFYVLRSGGKIIGCGGIAPYMGSLSESILVTIFVLPEYQGTGAGRKIVETLEADEYFLRAERISVHSSITARDFYLKLGYGYRGGVSAPDEEGCIHMEKRR